MNLEYFEALKQSYQDMIELLDKCIQEMSSGGMPMGIPKSVDRYANPNSDHMLPMMGKSDYGRLMLNITINNKSDAAEEMVPGETPEEEGLEDYVI